MPIPIIAWMVLALVATPPATNLVVGEQIDTNSNTALQMIEQLGEKYPVIGSNKVKRINERIQELERAKTEKAVQKGISALALEDADEISRRAEQLLLVRQKLVERNLTRAINGIDVAFSRGKNVT